MSEYQTLEHQRETFELRLQGNALTPANEAHTPNEPHVAAESAS